MGRGGNEIGEKEGRLTAAREFHALHIGGVAGDADKLDSGDDGAIVLEEREPARGCEGREIFPQIAGAIALGGMHGVVEFALLDNILSVRKGGDDFVAFDARVSAAMVEVEMRVDDDINVARLEAVVAQSGGKARLAEAVDVAELGVHFTAGARLDENAFPAARIRTQFMAKRMRLRPSGGIFFSHNGRGITPNIAPPSSRTWPSVRM